MTYVITTAIFILGVFLMYMKYSTLKYKIVNYLNENPETEISLVCENNELYYYLGGIKLGQLWRYNEKKNRYVYQIVKDEFDFKTWKAELRTYSDIIRYINEQEKIKNARMKLQIKIWKNLKY